MSVERGLGEDPNRVDAVVETGKRNDEFAFLLDLNRFRKKRFLGEGGFGRVYHITVKYASSATQTSELVDYAVKRSIPSFDVANGGVDEALRLLHVWNEWIYLSKITQRHLIRGIAFRSTPEIPAPVRAKMTSLCAISRPSDDFVVHKVSELRSLMLRCMPAERITVWLLMEYFPSISLFEFMNSSEITYPIFARISAQALLGVHEMHELNVVHNDIKPENFLVERKRLLVKVCDFGGMAQIKHQPIKWSTTWQFRAPERKIRGSMGTFKSDIFSLGKTFAEFASYIVWKTGEESTKALLRQMLAEMVDDRPDQRPDTSTIMEKYKEVFEPAVRFEMLEDEALTEATNVCEKYRLRASFSSGQSLLRTLHRSDEVPMTMSAEDPDLASGELMIPDDMTCFDGITTWWHDCCE